MYLSLHSTLERVSGGFWCVRVAIRTLSIAFVSPCTEYYFKEPEVIVFFHVGTSDKPLCPVSNFALCGAEGIVPRPFCCISRIFFLLFGVISMCFFAHF